MSQEIIQLRNENDDLKKQLQRIKNRRERLCRRRLERKRNRYQLQLKANSTGVGVEIMSIVAIIYPKFEKLPTKKVNKIVKHIIELIKEFPQLDHLSVAKDMQRWCFDKNKEMGLLRYRNFLKHAEQFKKDREEQHQGMLSLDDWKSDIRKHDE